MWDHDYWRELDRYREECWEQQGLEDESRTGTRPPWWLEQPEAERQPDETLEQFLARRDRFVERLARADRIFGYPVVTALLKGLSDPALSLAEKTEMVHGWLSWAKQFCAPIPIQHFIAHGRHQIIWSGCSVGCLESTRLLHSAPAWADYQTEMGRARELRRAPRDRRDEHKQRRAAKYLDDLLPKLAKKPGDTKLLKKAWQRLALLPEDQRKKYQGLIKLNPE